MIEHDNGCLPTKNDWPVSLMEVQRFLDTWCFSMSDDGFFYARPQSRSLSVPDVQAFLRRLQIVCGDGFPKLIAVDFSRAKFESDEWQTCETLLLEFAHRINALPVFEYRGTCSAFVVLVRSVASRSLTRQSLVELRQLMN